MDVDGPVIDHGRNELADDHVQDRDEDQQDQGVRRALRGICDDQQQDGRHEAADVWDETAEEDDDREWTGQRHTQEDQEQSLRDGVDHRDDGRPAKVAADPLEGDVSTRRDLLATPRVRRRQCPDPGLVTIHHEEEGQEGRKDRDPNDGPDIGRDRGDGRGHRRLDMRRDQPDDQAGTLRDLQGGQFRLDCRDTSLKRCDDFLDIGQEGDSDDDQGRADDEGGHQEDGRSGLDPRPATVPESQHVWGERGRNDRRDQDRCRDG